MVTISITAEACAAIRSTLPKGVRARSRLDEGGGFKITLDRHTLDRLKALRGPGESFSDVILRLAAETPEPDDNATRQYGSASATSTGRATMPTLPSGARSRSTAMLSERLAAVTEVSLVCNK
jgi:hypothetical protein